MESTQKVLEDYTAINKPKEPLAPYTHLRVGGPAEAFVQPRTRDELSAIVRRCFEKNIPLRVLGGGNNVLIRDEGVNGVVLRLSAPEFTQVTVDGKRVRAGSGVSLSSLISASARHGLAGLETLVGVRGTVGGVLRHNVGERSGEIAQFLRRVEVLDRRGNVQIREREDLDYGAHDDPVLLSGEFELERDAEAAIVKRMRKAWIQRKAAQPFSFQASGRMFKSPRGMNAAGLIEQAGLAGTRVGGAQVSERDANYIVADAGTSARDVLRLIELVRSRVQENFHVELELKLSIW